MCFIAHKNAVYLNQDSIQMYAYIYMYYSVQLNQSRE